MSDEQELAFFVCIGLHRRFLWGVCYELTGDQDAADDLLSEIIMHLHARFDKYDPARPFEPWARRVTKNYYYNRQRARKVRRAVEQTISLEVIADLPATEL